MAELGLGAGKVRLADHSREWHRLFEEEKELICSAIGAQLRDLQHVGSTAVAGIRAKPIIDMAGGVDDLDIAEALVDRLKAVGYEYARDVEISGHRVFAKGVPRTHLLHLVVYGGERWNGMIAFRDMLIGDAQIAREYDALKEKLAARYADNRPKYTKAKGPFIERALQQDS